jgi:hypothetical protein
LIGKFDSLNIEIYGLGIQKPLKAHEIRLKSGLGVTSDDRRLEN